MDAEGPAPRGFALPRAVRITQPQELRALFRRGKRRKTRHLDAFISASPSAFARWGVVVPKHKHEIVERNRVKRRLRELGRTVVLPRLGNSGLALDVLVRARPEAYAAGFEELRQELAELVEALCSRAS